VGLRAPEPGSRHLFAEIVAGPDASVDLAAKIMTKAVDMRRRNTRMN
jgi:hypothetical protein